MIYVINNNNSCFFNHAAEKYLMNNFDDEVFMLWVNKPSILIGRNQNTLTEINYNYVKDNNIDVVRRLSGGGAIYNDFGNINFTFITNRDKKSSTEKNSFNKFALPVIEALQSLGVNAEFTGRNDIIIEGKKFSGNAQYFQKDKLLHHGSILFDCDMSKLSLALKSKSIKFKNKGVKSVGARVTNILPHLDKAMALGEFREYLKNYIIDTHDIERIIEFNESDIEEIEKISEKSFKSWEWNYGKSPVYKYENSVKHPSGLVEYTLNVEKSIITNISIYGDYFGERSILELEEALIGVKHSRDHLEHKLKDLKLDDYIRGLTIKDLVNDLLEI
ncbi:lipoate--protein ligase [Senegalia sp. (in: firmicutes)]|uniref:lipoate--protein ligase n=2 Tax=Senegalia sp. (in: firmicutes) TaxID=1924098 RepID=UPI003F9DBA72